MTSRSARTSPRGSARRWSTGWSTRCSAASTPAAPRTCRSTRRCLSWRRWPASIARLLEAARAVQGARRSSDGPVFASVPGGLGRFAEVLTAAVRAKARVCQHGHDGPRARPGRGTAGGWRSAPTTDESVDRGRRCRAGHPGRPDRAAARRRSPEAAEALAGIAYASHGHRDAGVRRRARAARDERLAGAGGRGPAGQGGHADRPQVAAGRGRLGADDRALLGRPGGRRRRPAAHATTSWSTGCLADLADMLGASRHRGRLAGQPVGWRPAAVRRRAPRPCRAGARRGRRAARASRCAGPRTTGIGIPACIRSAYGAAEQVLRSAGGEWTACLTSSGPRPAS